MKRILVYLLLAALLGAASCSRYQSVKDDPMAVRIYTLDNGLKVYMTVNKDEPRIQTYIAARVGGKDDPSDNTGLAHYLEHMMFKGSRVLGTQDFAAERPMLKEIEALFEHYRTLTDPAEREACYRRIDSVSYEASKLAIPNEYDKLMSVIGSEGSNAFTSEDVTCYMEEIPSNQLDNWARIQADRFMNCVFRGFHTELEAVYEEKNMSMADDDEKAIDALNAMLFPHHPYGTQTVIGTQDHLKNPSIRAIRAQKDRYYVPNNMAICMSGDFDPDQTIRVIEKYFGAWPKGEDVPQVEVLPEAPATEPLVAHVYGQESEFVLMGWRNAVGASKEADYALIVNSVLHNGLAGLLDLDLLQGQKILDVVCSPYNRADWGLFLAQGYPQEGQSLEQVQALLQQEVDKLLAGDFPEQLVEAAKANYRLAMMNSLESNRSRVGLLLNSFVNRVQWQDEVEKVRRTQLLTKDDIVAWARQNLCAENLAVVYKHTGEDPTIKRITAPRITPIVTNRDKQSAFLQEIANSPVDSIEPSFVDYERDMTATTFNGEEFLYKKNEKNDLATLTFWYDKGTDTDPRLDLAADYIHYLGTAEKSATDLAVELYSLASKWNMNVSGNVTTITLRGLGENTSQVLSMAYDVLLNAVPDEGILSQLKEDMIRSRADAKMRQGSCNAALQRYMMFGPDYIKATTLTNPQLRAVTSEQLLGLLRSLLGCQHKIIYYGPASLEEVTAMLEPYKCEDLTPVQKYYPQKVYTREPKVFVGQYDSRQFNLMEYSNRGESLIVEQAPYLELFNEYYGGGMNCVVFQEMRESRALAYSAHAKLVIPSFTNDAYYFRATIASQNDKLRKAVEGFSEIIETLPESPEDLEIARSAILNKIRTQRVHGLAVLYNYLRMKELGLDFPREKLIYEKVGSLTMYDLLATHAEWVRKRTYHYAILGDTRDLDMGFLRTLGPVKLVSPEEMFGY